VAIASRATRPGKRRGVVFMRAPAVAGGSGDGGGGSDCDLCGGGVSGLVGMRSWGGRVFVPLGRRTSALGHSLLGETRPLAPDHPGGAGVRSGSADIVSAVPNGIQLCALSVSARAARYGGGAFAALLTWGRQRCCMCDSRPRWILYPTPRPDPPAITRPAAPPLHPPESLPTIAVR
jgi:hypothetical protein